MSSTSTYTLPAAASEGFKDASAYDAYRPSYPPAAVEALLSKLGVSGRAGARVVEVGSGTGKFTELLAARPERFEVVAVEPHAQMRAQLAAKGLAGVSVVEGHAGAAPVADGWADACVVAQAFHWFANGEALRDIHRLLKPKAALGLIWNLEDYNKPASWPATTAWEQKLNDVVHGLPHDGNPRFRDARWQDVFASTSANADPPLFGTPLGEDRVRWTVWLTPEALWRRLCTLSQVALLQGAARDAVRAALDEALAGDDAERNEKGEVALHGVTYFAWTERV